MKNSRDDGGEKKHTTTKLIICIIIILVIILLLITSCTSSFWGKIGNAFSNSEYIVDKNKNDKQEKVNKELTFDIRDSSISLDENEFKITYSYKNIETKNVTCTTSDADVATCVAYEGYVVVNPKKTGNVIITISTTFNDIVYKATSDLKVTEGKNGIKLSKYEGTIVLSNTSKKNVAYNLIGIKGKVDVKVENDKIATATVKNNVLKINALKSGSTKITLTVEYGGRTYEAIYFLTVVDDDQDYNDKDDKNDNLAKNRLKLNATYKQMYVKETFQLKKVSGGKIIKWVSTDKSIATVNKNGKVTAKKVGTVTIYAYDENGNQAAVVIDVIPKNKKQKLQLSVTEIILKVGETYTPVVIKGDADRWVSANKKIATVDKITGKITAISVGTTTITASDFWYFGNKATIKVTVIDDSHPIVPPEKEYLELDRDSVSLIVGDERKIRVIKGHAISWASENEAIAKVTSDGRVIAVGVGETTVRVIGAYGEVKTVNVSVKQTHIPVKPDEKIVLRKPNETITVGDKYDLYDFVEQGTPIRFEVSDPSKAVIQGDKIIFKSPGTITLTGYDKNGNQSSVIITIEPNKDPVITYPNIAVDKTRVDMIVGDKHTIKVIQGKPISFVSNNPHIVTVDSNGQLVGVNPGTAQVTVTGSNGETLIVDVTVSPKPAPVDPEEPIILKQPSKSILTGDVIDVSDIIKQGTPNRWVVSNDSIASIDPINGKVTFKNPGTVTITAYDKYGNSSTITIVVQNQKDPDMPIQNLVIDNMNIEMTVGDTEQISVSNGLATGYEGYDSSIIKVDGNGYITALTPGETDITVNGANGEKVIVHVKVNDKGILTDPDKDIALNKTKTEMTIGDSYTIPVVQGVADTWSSSDSSVLSVDNNGKVTAHKTGTVTITVVGKNGSIDTHTITVKDKKLELSTYQKDLYVGEKFTPAITTQGYESAVWSSSDESIAKVDPKTGEITGVNPGTTTIVVTNASGVTTEITVTVHKYVLDDLKVLIDGVEQSIPFNSATNEYTIGPVSADSDNFSVKGILPTSDDYKNVFIKYEINGQLVDEIKEEDLHSDDNKVVVKLFTKDENGNDVLANEYTVTVKKDKSSDASLDLYHGNEKIELDEVYKVDNKENPITLMVDKAPESTITKVILKHGDTATDITSSFVGTDNPSLNLEEGTSELIVTVVAEDGTTEEYTYTFERLERNIKIKYDDNNVTTLDISQSTYNLGFEITENDKDFDYELGDVVVLLDGVATDKVKVTDKGVLTVTPTVQDIGDHIITLKYKGVSADLNIKVIDDAYYLDTCPNGSGTCKYVFDTDYSEENKSTTVPLYTNILKYIPKEYEIDDKTPGVITITNPDSYDNSKIVITYDPTVAKIKFPQNTTSSDSYVLDVLLKNGDDVHIKVEAYRFGNLYKSIDDILVRVTKKHKLTLYANPYNVDSDNEEAIKNYFLDAESRKKFIKFLNENEEFDLTTFDPYQVDDTKNCYSYKFIAWTDDKGNSLYVKNVDAQGKVTYIKDGLVANIKLTKDLVLYASYSGNSELDKTPVYAYMDLQDLALFKTTDENNKRPDNYTAIDEKLIYPGASGGKGIRIINNTGDEISIVQFILQEDTLCVENNICLNMGYKIRGNDKYTTVNKYYYGNASDAGYIILNKDTTDIDGSTYSPWYHTYKELDIASADKITIPNNDVAEIGVLWKWIDDDANDYKIGEKAIDVNKYKFYLAIKYEKPKEFCKLDQTNKD